mgnify:CR=1 FL=1
MWKTAREERAELDKVVDSDSVLFGLCAACRVVLLGVVCVLRLVVRPRCLHWFSLILLRQSILLFFLLKLRHILLRHGAHRCKLRANLIDFVPLEGVLLANLLDLFVAEHATCLSDFLFVLFCASICSLILRVLAGSVFLFDFECRTPSSVLSKGLGSSLTICQALSGPFVRLRLLILVSIGKCLLPLPRVLPTCETANASNLANLVVDFVHVDVSFELLHGADEGHLTHHDDLLEQKVD